MERINLPQLGSLSLQKSSNRGVYLAVSSQTEVKLPDIRTKETTRDKGQDRVSAVRRSRYRSPPPSSHSRIIEKYRCRNDEYEEEEAIPGRAIEDRILVLPKLEYLQRIMNKGSPTQESELQQQKQPSLVRGEQKAIRIVVKEHVDSSGTVPSPRSGGGGNQRGGASVADSKGIQPPHGSRRVAWSGSTHEPILIYGKSEKEAPIDSEDDGVEELVFVQQKERHHDDGIRIHRKQQYVIVSKGDCRIVLPKFRARSEKAIKQAMDDVLKMVRKKEKEEIRRNYQLSKEILRDDTLRSMQQVVAFEQVRSENEGKLETINSRLRQITAQSTPQQEMNPERPPPSQRPFLL